MSNNFNFYEIVAGADNSRAMESETIQKNGASPKSLMSRGNFLINALLLIVFVASLTSCGGGGISGTWNAEYQNSPEYPTSFTFSGKSFTLKQFAIINDHIYCYTHEEKEKAKIVKDNRGRHDYYYIISNGKYSITDDKIEFILSDGTIRVYDFSRTENTITIGGRRFNKK